MTRMDIDDTRDALVLAALPHAAFDGWSAAALGAAARDLDLDPTMPVRLFPGGPADAVAQFVGLADRMMAADLTAHGLEGMKTGPKVFTAVKLRLERWAPHREAVRRALSLLALPANLPLAARLTWGTADAIWEAVGDTAHDFSWYTKRSTLAAVYSATVLYWLEDRSDDAADTWAFLNRRLADIGRIPKLRARVEGLLGGRLARMRR